ncbi:MAG: Uma2 family endonuclease [Symploca sp. SIO3E6]|nr:Uma2 family endonuclease [Caldora sp. SIO3E6]
MAQAVDLTALPSPMSLQAFLAWDNGNGKLYELIEGEPVPMSDPTANHEDVADDICDQLKLHCQEQQLPFVPKRSKLIAIASHSGRETARRGDIVVFEQAEWQRMKGLSSSAMAYTTPPLVIEVVSTNWRDDYLTKLAEYESIGIQEYWVVDYAALGGMRYIGYPKQPTLSIYNMDNKQGEFGQAKLFRAGDCLESVILPDFTVTTSNLWRAG